jgi:SAM-dependent methyltransferase
MMRTHSVSLQKGPEGYYFDLEPKVYEIVRFLKEQKAVSVLDVGCGTGRHSRFLAQQSFTVFALDISQQTLSHINQESSEKLFPVAASISPFQMAGVDAVVCFSTIHHGLYHEIKQTLGEIARVLRPGGFLFLDILSRNDPSYGIGTVLEPHTFVGGRSGEEDISHHYSDREELTRLFSTFKLYSLEEVCYELEMPQQESVVSVVFDVVVQKPVR